MNSPQQNNLRNPSKLVSLASDNVQDENLKGFFCEFLIKTEFAFDDSMEHYACQDHNCRFSRGMREMQLRSSVFNNEHNFHYWKALVWQFVSDYCPDYRYGSKYVDNYLYITPHFYIVHQDWFKLWNNVSSLDECRDLLCKQAHLLMSGDVESNPGPYDQHFAVIVFFDKDGIEISRRMHANYKNQEPESERMNVPDEAVSFKIIVCDDDYEDDLTDDGDVESNPGPVTNERHLSEVALKLKIAALERARQRQNEKNKTLIRKFKQLKKQKFQFQGLAEKINSPVGRSVMYGLANMVIPGTGTAAATAVEGPKLVNLLEKTNISMDQMKEAMESMKDQVPAAISKHMAMTDLATTTLSTINDILEQLKGGMSEVSDKFIGLKNKITSMNPVTLILSVIMCFVVASMPTKYMIGPILLLMAYLFGWHKSVIEKLKEILGKYQWFDGWQFQDGEEQLIPFIGQIIFTLLAFFGISQIPTDKFYDSLLRRLDIIPKAMTGAGKIWNAAGDTYRAVEMEFKVLFLGKDRERLLDEAEVGEQVVKWVRRVDHYLQVKNQTALAKDQDAVSEVTQLFDQMSRWKYTRTWKTMSKEAQRIIDSLVIHVTKLYGLVLKSSVHEGGPRMSPLAIMLSGISGRGKTHLMIPLTYALLHGRGHRGNYRNEFYPRNYETEYWDGYCGQKVVHFDDAFQVKDSVAKPSAEFMEAIRVNNVAPCHVHGADTSEKGRFFSSEICIYTTNLNKEFQKYIVSLNCPEAALRRLNMNAFEVFNKREFESELPDDKGKVDWRLDHDKVRNCIRCKEIAEAREDKRRFPFCPHIYEFQRYNIVTDQPIGEKMEYKSFIEYLLEKDKVRRNTEEDLLEQYEILETDPFAFQIGEDDEEFFDTIPFQAEETNHEFALDLSMPTEYLAYYQMQCYYIAFERFAKEHKIQNWQERLVSEMAHDPQLWNTYQRMAEYGVTNRDNPNTSLVDSMPDIVYDNDASIFMRSKHYPTWKVMRDSFYAYCSKVAMGIQCVWAASGFAELLSFGYMSLVMLAFALTIYRKFTSKDKVCFRCEQEEYMCVCMQMFAKYESAQSSGDVNQQSHPKVVMKTEAASSSGDVQIHKQASMRTEVASSSGEVHIPKTTALRTETIKLEDLQVEQMPTFEALADLCGRQVLLAITNKNLYCLHTDRTIYGNVLFLKGSTFLMPYHFVTAIKFNKDMIGKTMHLSNMSGRSVMEICTDDLINATRLVKDGDELDAAIVALDPIKNKAFAAHPDIVKNFMTKAEIMCFNQNNKYEGEIPSFCEMSAGLDRFMPNIKSCRAIRGYYDAKEVIEVQNEHTIINFRKMWTYMARTVNGDCGAPVILHEKGSSKKILGIHVAGQESGAGVAQCVTQEMLNEAFEKIQLKFQCAVNVDHMIDIIPGLDIDQVGSVPLKSGLIIHGKMPDAMQVRSGGKTKIMPSVLHNTIKSSLTLPTVLGPSNGIDPMELGLRKFGKITPRIDPKLIEIATTDVQNNLETNKLDLDKTQYARILMYDEAVQGVSGDEYLAPLNRSTSLGYPYTIKHPHAKGKRSAFGDDEWTMNSKLALEIENDVNDLIGSCRMNVQENVFWADTLKDERRPIEKVRAGKTRVFCAGPVHFTIAFRQYFLGFAAWVMKNRNANEISTGTNVFSHDWEEIVKKLQSRGKQDGVTNVVAGDFENFDGSLSSQILWCMLDMINEWYNDGSENAQIRRVLWTNIVHAVHVNGTMMYQASHSQPSGCPLTAILNSVYNSIVIRIVFLICAHKQENLQKLKPGTLANMKNFNDWVACVSYGDDNLIAIIKFILDWFNQVTIAEAFLTIGHVYTDEAKSGKIVPIRKLEDVAYLKRKFVWDELTQRHIAPLDIDVVLEIFQWTKKGLMKDDITLANIDVTMRELSLHGEDLFEHWKNALKQECIKQGVEYRFRTFEEYKAEVLDVPIAFEGREENIFEDDRYITHCVSADFRMSKGFARELLQSNRIKSTRQIDYLRTRQHQVGFVAFDHQSKVIHLVTKELYKDVPTDTRGLIRALSNLNLLLQQHKITKIAMPAMGCGLDGKKNNMCLKDLQSLLRMLLPNIDCKIYV